jgi:RHS repeat-associated protein
MVVNRTGTVEQVTHYYPYGGVIGDISTNENVQKYKFEGKELDRTFGLDYYDIHARQYFAMAPMWDRIDPLAEDSPQFSPYSYCSGNPVNLGDYDGMNPVFSIDGEYLGNTEEGFTGELLIYCGEEEIKNYNDISAEYLKKNGGYSFDELTDPHAKECFGFSLNDNEAGKIINSFLGQLSIQPGFQEYNIKTFGPAFSLDRITLSGVVYDSKYSQKSSLKVSAGSHFATLTKDAGGYQAGQILMSANRSYESTVENLAATIVYHEYYGHLIQRFGDLTGTHYKAYLNSKNCPYYNGTTQKYKEYLNKKLKH